MKTTHHLLRLLLLPFFLVALVALVLIYTTQSQLNQQFELTQQAQYADLQVLHNASQFAADLGQIQQRMEQAFSGAQDASLDELQLYRIHSGIANDLHTLGQQVAQLAQSTLVQEANHGSAAGLLREFENYRRFVIMSTDVLAVDPRVASRFWAQAQRHYSDFALFAARIEQRLTDRALQRNAQQSQTQHQLAQRMWAIGLGGLVLALTASYWLARRTSLRMQSIADALVQMVHAPHSQPNLLHIQKLHQQSHGPVQQLAGAVLAFRRALQRQHQAEEQALELLFYDPLTQLPNRRLLRERLQQALTRHAPLALLALDLDGFQHINDSCGHQVGDQVLQAVAQRLRTTTQGCEVLARTGGNSFAVLLTGLGHAATDTAAQAERMAEAMQSALAEPLQLQHTTHYISASIGITLFQAPLGNLDLPLQHAEAAMYQARTAGRGLVRFFDPDTQARIEARLHLENDLRQAIAGEQLRLFYQLQVDGQGRACGAEVLLRWQHPQRGMVSPGEFIPLAEASDLILPIGLWVLQGACQQLHAWAQQPHLAALSIAVNVSAKQFRQPDFVQQVCQAIATSGAPAQRLKLELTESVVLEEVENTIEKMAQLRALGVRFSMDDFGTGYSSLQYLKRLPLDQLKIEQGFVRDITNDSNDAAIVQTIIAMGRSLGLEVIAEGVETPAQHAFLSTHGCDLFQGYLFAKPQPIDQAERLLQAWHSHHDTKINYSI